MIQTALSKSLLLRQCNGAKLLNKVRYMSSKIDFDKLVKQNKVVVFMKGTPQSPRCGFSNAVVQVLKLYDVEFEAHDVLSSEEMRQGIKEYTSWPTIPQVFINGEFVGGCDVLVQMHYDKKLNKEFEKAGIKSAEPNKGESKEENKN